MKAAVFHKPGDIRYDTMPDPRIELATDTILKVTSIAICGSDLHILSGAVPQKEPMIDLMKTEKVVLDDIITHKLPLSQVSHGYKIFDEKEEDCVKVVLKPGE